MDEQVVSAEIDEVWFYVSQYKPYFTPGAICPDWEIETRLHPAVKVKR